MLVRFVIWRLCRLRGYSGEISIQSVRSRSMKAHNGGRSRFGRLRTGSCDAAVWQPSACGLQTFARGYGSAGAGARPSIARRGC